MSPTFTWTVLPSSALVSVTAACLGSGGVAMPLVGTVGAGSPGAGVLGVLAVGVGTPGRLLVRSPSTAPQAVSRLMPIHRARRSRTLLRIAECRMAPAPFTSSRVVTERTLAGRGKFQNRLGAHGGWLSRPILKRETPSVNRDAQFR